MSQSAILSECTEQTTTLRPSTTSRRLAQFAVTSWQVRTMYANVLKRVARSAYIWLDVEPYLEILYSKERHVCYAA